MAFGSGDLSSFSRDRVLRRILFERSVARRVVPRRTSRVSFHTMFPRFFDEDCFIFIADLTAITEDVIASPRVRGMRARGVRRRGS